MITCTQESIQEFMIKMCGGTPYFKARLCCIIFPFTGYLFLRGTFNLICNACNWEEFN